jgi:hypothetical protein
MDDPMDLTMASAKRHRDSTDKELSKGTPNPQDKKHPRSIIKAKKPKENEEETSMNKANEGNDDDITDTTIMPPEIRRKHGKNNDDIKNNLSSQFEDIIKEKSTDKTQKNKSGNEEIEISDDEGNEDNKGGNKAKEKEEKTSDEEEEEDNNEEHNEKSTDKTTKNESGNEEIEISDDEENADNIGGNKTKEKEVETSDEEEEEESDEENKNDKNNDNENEDKKGNKDKKGKNEKVEDTSDEEEEEVKKEEEDNDEEEEAEASDKDEQNEDDGEKEDMMDEDKYVIDIPNGKFKRHTAMWKEIPEAVMKASKIFTIQDEAYIKQRIEDIGKDMGVDVTNMDKSKWIKVLVATKNISAGRDSKRYVRIFGVSMARSIPTNLFDEHIFNGNKLLETDITMIWAAAYTLYGPGWLPDYFDIVTIPPTETFHKHYSSIEVKKTHPFKSSDVYGDGAEALHNVENMMRKICKINVKAKEVVEPQVWEKAMKKAIKNKFANKARKTCLKLAMTPVSIFKELDLLKDDNELVKIAVTSIWAGAQLLLGQIDGSSIENLKKAPKTTPAKEVSNQVKEPATPGEVGDKEKTPAKATTVTKKILSAFKSPNRKQNPTQEDATSAVKFTPATKAEKKPGNHLFISMPKPVRAASQVTLSKRKFKGYYKIKLPSTINEFGNKAIEEVMTHISNFTAILWAIDKKAELLPWYDNSNTKPFCKSSKDMKTKEDLNKFSPSVFIKQGQNTWLRVHIAHDVNKEKFMETEDFKNHKLQVSYDKVQAKKTQVWGWLLGLIPETANLNHMKQACEAHPLLKEFQLEARVQVIKLMAGKQDTPLDMQVKAIHIIGDDTLTAKGRKALNQTFGSRTPGYPQQRPAKFIPNAADTRFPVTQQRLRDIVKMIGKQKKIMKLAKPLNTDTICGLHYLVPELGYTLCQILMSMRSPKNPEIQLFMAVDERSFGGYGVTFTVHADRLTEATTLIPLLSVVLEAKFGPRIWNWFTDQAKEASQGYVYDTENGCLKNIAEDESDVSSIESGEDEFAKQLSEMYNLSSGNSTENGDKFDLDLSFMLEDQHPKNQYGDSGSVKTFREQDDKTIEIDSSSDEESNNDKSKEADKTRKNKESHQETGKEPKPTQSPGNMSVDTSNNTQETSTLSDSMVNPEQQFAKMCLQNPDFLARFLKNNPSAQKEVNGESKTPAQKKDPLKASQEEGDEAS